MKGFIKCSVFVEGKDEGMFSGTFPSYDQCLDYLRSMADGDFNGMKVVSISIWEDQND